VYAVLRAIGGEQRVVTPKANVRHVTESPIVEGLIYPCVYLTKEDFYNANPPKNHRKFIVIRDLRDTLISQYYSFLYSHEVMDVYMQKQRETLSNLSVSEGLMNILKRKWMPSVIQLSWIESDDLCVRFEDLIADEHAYFHKIISYCGIEIEEEVFNNIIKYNTFEKLSGRNPGIEDVKSHFRKGISGDWKNYFDDSVKNVFKERYGHILIKTGYEKDLNW
jgi:lipopolysaccharide transport system ATP-binding protein